MTGWYYPGHGRSDPVLAVVGLITIFFAAIGLRLGAKLVTVCIRSPGKNGKFETNRYVIGHFDPTAYDEDIVWVDGYFIRSPEGVRPSYRRN